MLTLCHNFFNVRPNNKSSKDAGKPFDKKRYLFGLFILLLVDVLWVVSSELTKYIYTDLKFERPFLVTYVRSSLLFVYLIVLCFSPPTKDPCQPADYTQLLEPAVETDEENFYSESGNSLGDSTFVPVRAGETTDSDDAAPRAVRFNKVAEVRVMSASQAGEALLARLSWAASMRASEMTQRRAAAAATRRHLRRALVLAMPWFMSNYLYRVSLTSGTAGRTGAMLGAGTALAAALLRALSATSASSATSATSQQSPPRAALLLAALAALTAIVILFSTEGRQGDYTSSLAALGSALFYAVHLVLFRRELRKSEGINSLLFAGLVGGACACVSWSLGGVASAAGWERAEPPPAPLVAWLLLDAALGPPLAEALWLWTAEGVASAAGWERAEPPPAPLLAWLLLDAALGPPLAEALWLWGNSLTSSHTATLCLGAGVPLPLAWEWWRGGGSWSAAAATAAAAGAWLLAAADTETVHGLVAALPARWHHAQGFTTMRDLPDLDEQSEALMSSDEPT